MNSIDTLKQQLKELNKRKKDITKEILSKEIELENLLNSVNQYKLL
jgi:hypothetical protein